MSFLCVSQQKASTEDPVSVWPPVTVLSYARDVVFIASSASFDAELHNSKVRRRLSRNAATGHCAEFTSQR